MKKRILFISIVAVLVIASFTGVLAASGVLTANTKQTSSTNPDDAIEYIQYTSNNGLGGYEYSFKVGTANAMNAVGTIVLDNDYMYVYGMYYKGTSAPTTTSTANWENQTSNIGWGCVARSKTKSTYQDPYGSINEEPVTHYNRCYQNCTNMTLLPNIPCTAKNTSYLAAGCTSLSKVELNGISRLDEYAFNNCSNLSKIYIGSSVTTIVATSKTSAPFYGVKSSCECYCSVSSVPSGFGTYWSSITNSVAFSTSATPKPTLKWSSDYLIDYVNN